MFDHTSLWAAIDRLADLNGLSPSGLAKKAWLSPTLFNPSKRQNDTRKRWPSTESIAAILKATDSTLADFIALIDPKAASAITALPMAGLEQAADPKAFDTATGALNLSHWDKMPIPGGTDAKAFALEITGRAHEPTYREGDRIILSPAAQPRRGDHVCACTRAGEIIIRSLGREGAQKVELLPIGANGAPLTFARKDILWLYRIIWASR